LGGVRGGWVSGGTGGWDVSRRVGLSGWKSDGAAGNRWHMQRRPRAPAPRPPAPQPLALRPQPPPSHLWCCPLICADTARSTRSFRGRVSAHSGGICSTQSTSAATSSCCIVSHSTCRGRRGTRGGRGVVQLENGGLGLAGRLLSRVKHGDLHWLRARGRVRGAARLLPLPKLALTLSSMSATPSAESASAISSITCSSSTSGPWPFHASSWPWGCSEGAGAGGRQGPGAGWASNGVAKGLAFARPAQHSTAQHSTAQHSTAQHNTAQHSTAQHSTARRAGRGPTRRAAGRARGRARGPEALASPSAPTL
jgi:hypothetical protein